MTEREEIEFNVRQALADKLITPEQSAYVKAQVELEEAAAEAWKGMETK